MGYKVIFSTQSNRDLGHIVSFLAQKNPAAAGRLGYALVDRALSAGAMPHMGAAVRERRDVRRILRRPWFLIYYRVDDTSRVVEIVRIWDARQNPAGFSLGE
jgi:plasmid stabilization system protein ParE